MAAKRGCRDSALDTYLLFGLRVAAMRWNYQHRVVFEDETSVASDGVLVITPYIGVGGSLLRVEPIEIGAGIGWGPRITLTETFKNFDNDLFRTVGELRFNLEASLFF